MWLTWSVWKAKEKWSNWANVPRLESRWVSLPKLSKYDDHICFKPNVRTYDLISNQQNVQPSFSEQSQVISWAETSKDLEEGLCSFLFLVSCVEVREEKSNGVIRTHQLSAAKVKEASSGTTEAGLVLGEIVNCVLDKALFHLRRESFSFPVTREIPVTH